MLKFRIDSQSSMGRSLGSEADLSESMDERSDSASKIINHRTPKRLPASPLPKTPSSALDSSPGVKSPFLTGREQKHYASISKLTPVLPNNMKQSIENNRQNTLSPNPRMKIPNLVLGPTSPRDLKSTVIGSCASPEIYAQPGVNCSTPKINIYSSEPQENIYSTPCNDDTHKEPTYQSLAQTDVCSDSFVDENMNSMSFNDTNTLERKCLTKDENNQTILKPDLDYMNFITPNRFLAPVDRSSFCRTPSKYMDDGVTWQDMTRNILCLLSLMMNCESMIHFPLFVVRWKGQGLIIYLIMLVVIGLPALIMEVLVGSLEKCSSLKVWSSMVPLMSGIGPALGTASIFLAAKTCAIVCYSMVYLVSSLQNPLPWTECEEWWGSDSKCFSTKDIEHFDLNRSLLCTLYDLAGEDCHSHNIPSHVQFWEKHVLKIDHHGLRVLGHLGSPNLMLLLFSACLWTVVGLTTLASKQLRTRLISMSTVLVLVLIFVSSVWNVVEHGALSSLRDYLSMGSNDILINAECYLEAFWLVVTGISIFNGSLVSYSAMFKKVNNIKLISMTCLLLHVLFIVLTVTTILPLLPTNLDATEMMIKKEIGYFPLALLSLDIEASAELSVVTSIVYFIVVITGFNYIMGLASSVQLLRKSFSTRLQKLNVGFWIGVVGFLSSLPLLYQAGPSMLPLYYIYGYKVPVHVLAPCLCIGVFWLYGSRRLASRVQGGCGDLLLAAIWLINPLALMALGVLYHCIGLSVPEPIPLPGWAVNLGIFLAVCSIVQVFVGILMNLLNCIKEGKPLLVREQTKIKTLAESRSLAELCELKESVPSHSNTYKSFDDLIFSAQKK